jgi:hypothetical protein
MGGDEYMIEYILVWKAGVSRSKLGDGVCRQLERCWILPPSDERRTTSGKIRGEVR